jgi:hypothetical protein
MSLRKLLLLFVAATAFLAGCASTPQAPVAVAPEYVTAHAGRVGVVMSALPKVDTDFPGAGCLLCLAAASMANSSLTAHTHTLATNEVASYQTNAVDALRKKGFDATAIPDPLDVSKLPDAAAKTPNHPKKDFGSLKAKYNVDKLYVLQVSQLGFTRSYAAYVPTSDPHAAVAGEVYIVDLATNAYDWYERVNVTTAADGKWDEPPSYPGLTNAYFQAIELARDHYVGPFKH